MWSRGGRKRQSSLSGERPLLSSQNLVIQYSSSTILRQEADELLCLVTKRWENSLDELGQTSQVDTRVGLYLWTSHSPVAVKCSGSGKEYCNSPSTVVTPLAEVEIEPSVPAAVLTCERSTASLRAVPVSIFANDGATLGT